MYGEGKYRSRFAARSTLLTRSTVNRDHYQVASCELAERGSLASLHFPPGFLCGSAATMDAAPLPEHLLYDGDLLYGGRWFEIDSLRVAGMG